MSLHNKVILYTYFQFHNIRTNIQNCGAVSSSTGKTSTAPAVYLSLLMS